MFPLSIISKKVILSILLHLQLKSAFDEGILNYLMVDVQSLIQLLNELETVINNFITLVQSRPKLPNQQVIINNFQNILINIDIHRTILLEYQATFQTSLYTTVNQLKLVSAFDNPNWINTNNIMRLCKNADINTLNTLLAVRVFAKIKVTVQELANIGLENKQENELMELINNYSTIFNNLTIRKSPDHMILSVANNMNNNLKKFNDVILSPISTEVVKGTDILKDLL